MALKLSAPVGDRKRITKLDPKTGECKFKPVKTALADFELVRLMLKANGCSVEISTKCDARQEELRRKVLAKANLMQGQAEFWVDFCNEVESTRKGNDTFLNALTEFAVSMVNDKSDPPWTPILNARSEASFLRTLTSKKKPDWKTVYQQDVKASRANNTGGKAFKKFIDQ